MKIKTVEASYLCDQLAHRGFGQLPSIGYERELLTEIISRYIDGDIPPPTIAETRSLLKRLSKTITYKGETDTLVTFFERGYRGAKKSLIR